MANLRIEPALNKVELAIKHVANQAQYTGMRNLKYKARTGYTLQSILMISALLYDELRGVDPESRYGLVAYLRKFFAQ